MDLSFNKSIWENESFKSYKSLNKSIKTSVAVVGGGITGILTAFLLCKNGVDCVLVEAKSLCSGITKNTTGKITSGHSLIYSKLLKTFGKENAQKYYAANEQAIKDFKSLCENIDCDFEERPSFVYSKEDRMKIEDEVKSVNLIGGTAKFVQRIEIPLKIAGAIKFENQAQFNPLKFLKHLSCRLNVYENTMVNDIQGKVVFTDKGNITADKIVVATHFPFINRHGFYFAKMYQKRSYVLALQDAQKISGMYIDESEDGLSFREYKGFLLVGGKGNRTGTSCKGYDGLRSDVKKLYPDSIEKYFWSTQDCITLDKVPYIGRYSKNFDNVFVATGFNKWGMTSSMVASKILTDLILDRPNEFIDVFSAQRMSINKQFFLNTLITTKNLLTPTTKRCPHLGCALKFNYNDNSWDCPCHGSRFDSLGNLIDNPAIKNAKIKNSKG